MPTTQSLRPLMLVACWHPGRLVLRFDEGRHPVMEHEERHESKLAGLVGVDAAVVQQYHVVRKPVERSQTIDACGVARDYLQLRRIVAQFAFFKPIANDVDPG